MPSGSYGRLVDGRLVDDIRVEFKILYRLNYSDCHFF